MSPDGNPQSICGSIGAGPGWFCSMQFSCRCPRFLVYHNEWSCTCEAFLRPAALQERDIMSPDGNPQSICGSIGRCARARCLSALWATARVWHESCTGVQ